jgi:hypothetical protein
MLDVVFLSITKKMQRYIILFIIVNVLQVSNVSRSSSGAQICTRSIRYLSKLFAGTASVDELVTVNKFD